MGRVKSGSVMDVILSTEKVDEQECDVLVTGVFQDERPLQGVVGWIDWRLNGKLSRFLIDQKLTGEWKETTLIPSQGRITPRMILLLGLGKWKEYTYFRLRELSPHVLETLHKLNITSLCLALPHGEVYNVECGKLAAVLFEGIVDCLHPEGDALDEEWIRSLRLFFPEEEERFKEILLGIQTVQSIFENRLNVRILVPSQSRV
jgi:Cytosol aminopeptidase family, N-terminal domain